MAKANPSGAALDALNALSADALAARLSADPATRTAFVAEAAQAGVAEAQLLYGQLLLDGNGVRADAEAAFGWFWRAAQQHHPMAINMLGRCYDLGWGTAPDKIRAAQCFKTAADHDLDWGLYNYATALTLGEGVAQDRPAALALFRKAAARGNAKSSNYVGSFYEDGWVVERDLAQAEHHYRIAAEGGDFRGCFNLARLLGERGEDADALYWLAQVRHTATPAFLQKAQNWLTASPLDLFRNQGVAALDGALDMTFTESPLP